MDDAVVHKANGPYPTSEYEHSSIPGTVKKLFNLSAPFLTKRDAWAGTFEHIFMSRIEPRTDCPGQSLIRYYIIYVPLFIPVHIWLWSIGSGEN